MFGRCLQVTRKLERLLETKLQFKFRKTFGQSLFRSENWDVSFERFVGGCFLLSNWNVPPTSLMSSGTLGRAGLSSTDLCFHSTNVTICVSLLNQVPFLHWKTTNIPTGWSAGFSHPVCVASWSSPGGTKTGTLYGRERVSLRKCACARAHQLAAHTSVHTSRHGRYFVRDAYINDLFPLLLWTQHCTICLVDVSINMYMR